MGLKFYRGSDKPKKIRKRLEQTRSWFRTFKWVSYFAHPVGIPGHPFKGGQHLSQGQLFHPEIKRFEIGSAIFFKPPRPGFNPYEKPAQTAAAVVGAATLTDAISNALGTTKVSSNDTCKRVLTNLKTCYENHKGADADEVCAHYAHSLKKNECAI